MQLLSLYSTKIQDATANFYLTPENNKYNSSLLNETWFFGNHVWPRLQHDPACAWVWVVESHSILKYFNDFNIMKIETESYFEQKTCTLSLIWQTWWG